MLTAATATALMFVGTPAFGQSSGTGEARGELLYSTYCIGCHTTQVHWRAKGLVTDWISLKGQVRRWYRNVGLGSEEDDIAAVARYLNDLFYHFPTADTGFEGSSSPHRTVARRAD
jgi:mono/diheme cytochrome c family protein